MPAPLTCLLGTLASVAALAGVAGTALGSAVTLHVHPTRGDDAQSGSVAAPLRSVTAARDRLREMRPLPAGGATVQLHAGAHHAPFALTGAADSGRPDAPIVYTSAPGERATVSGALPVPASAFQPWSGGAAGVLRADLAPLGITAPMLGGMQIPTSEGSMNFGSCQHDKAELFWGGEAMTLARFPNKAADGTWRFLHADLAGAFGPGSPGGASGGSGTWFLMKPGANASRISSWASKDAGSAWLHGYWQFDWADSYRKLASAVPITHNGTSYINVTFVPDTGNIAAGLQLVKTNARFYGVNLLSELDQPGEYFIDEKSLHLYFMPDGKIGDKPAMLSVNTSAVVTLANTTHTSLENLEVGFGRSTGISATGIDSVLIRNVTVYGLGTSGIELSGTNSAVVSSEISHTGCAGMSAGGGVDHKPTPGNLTVRGNRIHHIGNWKRTYMPAIRFSGSGNVYAENVVSHAPHTCMTGGGTNLTFEGNTLDTCCYESSDVGAFYVCGQGGTAFWGGRGGRVLNNTFKNIRNMDGTGVQGPSVQALYLDDQMSGWEVADNRFINCMAGSFIGGGRDNHVHNNYYERCDLAQHFDNRGMGWEQSLCNCTSGSTCDPFVAKQIVDEWPDFVAAYPQIRTAVLGGQDICVPVNNVIENNRYCKVKQYLDATAEQISGWHSTARNNSEVHTC